MKKNQKSSLRILPLLLAGALLLSACGENQENTQEVDEEKSYITIGFSQVGAESDWRNANTESMRETFTKEKGYELIIEDGQQKQSNQMMAIRKFIQQEVDYIVLAPVTESGWDTVLEEAKEAKIPVIIIDRMVDVKDLSLYTCWVGSNFIAEGTRVMEWLSYFSEEEGVNPEDLHIAHIQGNLGNSAQIGRTQGLNTAVEKYGFDLLESVPADFTQTRGKEVMEEFLRKYPNLNVVYCENDNMAFGAIQAIEQAGKVPGSDIEAGEIMVLSFDGVSPVALQYVKDGTISCIGECNPDHGPRVEKIIQGLERGTQPTKQSYVEESVYTKDNIEQ